MPYFLLEIFPFLLGIFKGLQAQTLKNSEFNISYKDEKVGCVDLKNTWWHNF